MLFILLLPIFAHCLPRWGTKPTNDAKTYTYAHAKSSSIRSKKPTKLQLYVNKRILSTAHCDKLPVWRQAKFEQFENKDIEKIVSVLHQYCLRYHPFYNA